MSDRDDAERDALPLSGPGDLSPEPPRISGYEIIDLLGEGGMGTVWRARQLGTRREIALKVMSPRMLRSKRSARIRFEREVTLAARLEHPNIARIYESGIDEDRYFYAMELIQGQPLDEYAREHRLSRQAVVLLMYTVCQAVQFAHQRGIIHRDLKPSNILVTPDGQPHVLDFGLARDLLSQGDDKGVSVDGDLIGTPIFMSPEQAAGDIEMIDTRSDVYSLGVILYHLLTGDWPYEVAGSPYRVCQRILEQEPVRPSTVTSGVDRDLEAVLLKALAKLPQERYRFAGELGDDIDRWLKRLPVSARSIDAVYLLRKFIWRHRAATAVALLIFAILLGAASMAGYAISEQRRLREDTYEQTLGLLQQAAFSVFVPEEARQPDVTEGDRCFWSFAFAEFLLRNGHPKEAEELYRRCLATEIDNDDTAYWVKEKAAERITELGQQRGVSAGPRGELEVEP